MDPHETYIWFKGGLGYGKGVRNGLLSLLEYLSVGGGGANGKGWEIMG